jgi:hypothetical protein
LAIEKTKRKKINNIYTHMGIILKYIKQIIYPLLIIGGILSSYSQTFTHSGFIYGSNAIGIPGVQVQLYSRTTPTMPGFTSQQNYNGHSYYRSTGSMTWTAARQACTNMGGYLVTINSAAENNFIFNLWPSGWIGLTDEVVEGQWRWVTGEPVTYTNWNSGEPNNAGNEDYAQFVSNGRWNDLPNVALPYVLEFNYIVTFTPWTLLTTSTTNAIGRYSFSTPTNPSIEYYITFTPPVLTVPVISDGTLANNIVIGNTSIKSVDYFRYDVNGDNRFTVSDTYSILARKSGLLSSFTPTPVSRIFNSTEWSAINSSTANLKISYPGLQSVTINSPVSGGSSNYYITRLGNTN